MSIIASAYIKFGVVITLFGMITWYYFGPILALGPLAVGIGLLASPLLIAFPGVFIRHANKTALDEWTGNYYHWNNQHIRIIHANDCAWVIDEDLISAAGMKMDKKLRRQLEVSYSGYGTIPGTRFHGFNEKAVLKFLEGKQERNPEIIKLLLWFQREVFMPLRNKRERDAPKAG